MSVFVVRAFVKMRSMLTDTRALARKLAALEKELKDRLDVHEAAIVTILQRVMDLVDLPPQLSTFRRHPLRLRRLARLHTLPGLRRRHFEGRRNRDTEPS